MLHQRAVIQRGDQIGVPHRRQAVRDHERGASDHQFVERVEDDGLCFRIDRRGGLVENEDGRVLEKGARDADALAFASGQPHAALADLGLVAVGQALDEFVGVGRLGGLDDLLQRRLQAAVPDVVGDRPGKEHRVLGHHADLAAQRLEAQRPHVAPVEEHTPALRIVETRDQVHQRGLPGAGRPHDGDDLAGLHVERDVGQRAAAAGVFEVHALESHGAGGPADGLGMRRFLHHRLGIEDVERHAQTDQVVLKRTHRVADGLERFVDRRDVRQHHQQLAGGDASLNGVVSPDA